VVRASERSETRALVIILHANPVDGRRAVYRDLVQRIAEASRRLAKPVLMIHGDTHVQREDMPLKDSLGNVLLGITRLETFGSPFVGWIHVTVDPDDPQVFRISPRLQGIAAHR
jgi:hypothetical protein